MKRFIFSAMAVGMFAIGANAACGVTYSIGSKDDLNNFRDVVNGLNGKTKNTAACAVLTADIQYNTTQVVDDDLSGLNSGTPASTWTPIVDFAGTFDGQGHKISGLYYSASADAGLFASVNGTGVVIKNVRVEDSYFEADTRIGGIVADVKVGSSVKIDNVSFKGHITTKSKSNRSDGWCNLKVDKKLVDGNFGGIVGNVAEGVVSVALTNSFNEAKITTANECTLSQTSGGLIGYVWGSTTMVTMSNCYDTGVVERADDIGTIFGQNVSSGKTTASDIGCTTKDDTYCKTTSTASALEESFATNIATQKSNTATSLNDPETGAKGVTFTYNSETKKLTATINSAATEFSLPQDVLVDTIKLDRVFTENVYSTIMLPFSVAVSSVTGATEFATFTGVTKNSEGTAYTAVNGTSVKNGNLAAYTPYLLKTSGTTLTVSGAVTLKANSANTTTAVGDWSFIGTTAKKRWQNQCDTDASKCANKDEIGKVYGFSGSIVGDIKVGNFVKVGNKVSISPMRAYLMYTGSENLPVAKGKPAAPGMAMAAAVESVPTVVLPDTMKVIIVDPVVEDPEEEVPTEGPLALDPVKAPAAAFKADRWYDITGRNLNKPKAQGAYINNRTTVIVK